MLTVYVNILYFLCLHAVVGLNDGLSFGWGDVQLENKCVLPGSHIAYFLVRIASALRLQIIEDDVFDLSITEASKHLFFAVDLQKMLHHVKGKICTFEFSLV